MSNKFLALAILAVALLAGTAVTVEELTLSSDAVAAELHAG